MTRTQAPAPAWLAEAFFDDTERDALQRMLGGHHRVAEGPLTRFEDVFGDLALDVTDLLRRYADARLEVRAFGAGDAPRIFVPDADNLPPFDLTFAFPEAGRVHATARRMELALSQWLGLDVLCNIYCSRGQATFTGLQTHFDEYPVMVLQVAGSKRWCLGGVLPRYPELGMPAKTLAHPFPAWFSAAYRPGEVELAVAHEVVLRPGTVLTIPAAMWHATTTEDTSISMTFGVRAAVWIGVLRHALRGLAMDCAPELFAPACPLLQPDGQRLVPWPAIERLGQRLAALEADRPRLLQALRAIFGGGTLRWSGPIRTANATAARNPESGYPADIHTERPAHGAATQAQVGHPLWTVLHHDAAAIATLDREGPGRVITARGPLSDWSWASDPELEAICAGAKPRGPVVPANRFVARVYGSGAPTVAVAVAPQCKGTDALADTMARGLASWADEVSVRIFRSLGPARQSAWLLRACDTVLLGLAGHTAISLGATLVVADDEEVGAGLHFSRSAEFPPTPIHAAPTPEQTWQVEPGAVCVVPRGTWFRVEDGDQATWLSIDLETPSWLGLIETSLVSASALCPWMSTAALRLGTGALQDDAGALPAVRNFSAALRRVYQARAETWSLWRDSVGYRPGRLLLPIYEACALPWRFEDSPVAVVRSGSEAAPVEIVPEWMRAMQWVAAEARQVSLAGLAQRLSPGCAPGDALRVAEALVDRGLLRRVRLEQRLA